MRGSRPPCIVNVSGGADHAMSLAQLTGWCDGRFGAHAIKREPVDRPYDIPWLVLDSSRAREIWDWRPATALAEILEEIAATPKPIPNGLIFPTTHDLPLLQSSDP